MSDDRIIFDFTKGEVRSEVSDQFDLAWPGVVEIVSLTEAEVYHRWFRRDPNPFPRFSLWRGWKR